MKSSFFVITLVIVCGGIACAVAYLNRARMAPPAPLGQPAAATSPAADSSPAPEKIAAPTPETLPAVSANVDISAKVPAATPVFSEAKLDDSAAALHKAVDALLSAKSAGEKHDAFEQLAKSGQLDAAVAELQQRMMDNPTNAEIPTTLGEAQLNKIRTIKDAGGDVNDMGILAMQADKNFNAALKIDPQNWEANFVKAASMYYWPADPTRDADVVQRLSGLIDQQETMTPNPGFAQSFVVLGNEYQKLGQPDKAAATWQLGLAKFPDDPTLLKKINGQ